MYNIAIFANVSASHLQTWLSTIGASQKQGDTRKNPYFFTANYPIQVLLKGSSFSEKAEIMKTEQ